MRLYCISKWFKFQNAAKEHKFLIGLRCFCLLTARYNLCQGRQSEFPSTEGQFSGLLEHQILPRRRYIKNTVYGEEIRDLQHLWDRITAAIATETSDVIQRTWHEIDKKLNICQATNVVHIVTY
jgi:hypothetical protein